MTSHQWTKLTSQVGDVIVAPDGEPFFSERPGEPIGEVVGCDLCGVPMTQPYVELPCEPIDIPAMPV